MAAGQRCITSKSIGSGANYRLQPDVFTSTDGTSLTTSDAVIVRAISHENDVTIRRYIDVDDDGTAEGSVPFTSYTGAGTATDLNAICTDKVWISIIENASTTQNVSAVGEALDGTKVWAELGNPSSGAQLSRTTGSKSDETIYEACGDAAWSLDKLEDIDDDGTFELSVTDIESSSGAASKRFNYSASDNNSSNPRVEWRLTNDSGSTNQYALLGTIGSKY